MAEEESAAAQELLKHSVVLLEQSRKKRPPVDHRKLPRSTRRKFRHDEALHCILRDYLGIREDLSTPIFAGSEFATMFRVSRPRFERMLQDYAQSGISIFTPPFLDNKKQEGASLEARLLLPMKSIAFGVPPKTFTDYFQMSKNFAKDCYHNFTAGMVQIYKPEYLRLPTQADLRAIISLHRSVHRGVNGMFGSLDCMHTY